jgi:hypothetical protein
MARVYPVFNISLLESWVQPFAMKGFRLGPVQIPKDVLPVDRYEVKGILEHRNTQACGREYLVKWLG